MDYNINYRGLVISIVIDENTTNVSYVKNGNEYSLNISDRISSKLNKSITMPFSSTIKDSEGKVLSVKSEKCIVKGSIYDYFYNLLAQREMGQFLDRGSVNAVLEYHFNEQVYPFNITKNYDEMQPIIFDYTVLEGDIRVDLVDYDATKTVEYSLDGIVWQSENSFVGLDNGEYTIYVQTVEDGYKFSKPFTISVTEEV